MQNHSTGINSIRSSNLSRRNWNSYWHHLTAVMKQSKATVERGAGALIWGEKGAGVAELPFHPSSREAAEILGCFGSYGRRRAPASPGTLQRIWFGHREISHHLGATGNALSADNPPPSRRTHNPPHASPAAQIGRELVFFPKTQGHWEVKLSADSQSLNNVSNYWGM